MKPEPKAKKHSEEKPKPAAPRSGERSNRNKNDVPPPRTAEEKSPKTENL